MAGLAVLAYTIYRAWKERGYAKEKLLGLQPGETSKRKLQCQQAYDTIAGLIQEASSAGSKNAVEEESRINRANNEYMTNQINEEEWRKRVEGIKYTLNEQKKKIRGGFGTPWA